MTNKSLGLRARITIEENEAFKKVAETLGIKRGRLIRKFIRECINGEMDLLDSEQSVLKFLIRQLTGIANNLNQITTAIHTGVSHRSIDENYLQEIRQIVLSIKTELQSYMHKTNQRWVKDDELR